MKRPKGIKLQIIISLIILLVIISTVAITWTISMSTYKRNSTDNHMTSNLTYVQKLSNMTEYHLDQMLQNLISFRNLVEEDGMTQEDLENWFEPNQNSFNSIFITDKEGVIQSISPEKVVFEDGAVITKGVQITDQMVEQIVVSQEPFISDPYRAKSGQLITLLSVPIFESGIGEFKGAISGTIHMETDNVLEEILGNEMYDELTYVYVVDRHGRLIYHPFPERLWEDVSENEVVKKVLNGESGSQVVVNTKEQEFLASYAYVENVGWGIVSQTATTQIYEPISALFWRIVISTTPFLVIVLLLSGLFVSTITKPINTLANYSKKMMEKSNIKKDELPPIRSSVYEVQQLYEQVSNHLRVLSNQVSRDGLTNLANRRTFDQMLHKWLQKKYSFTLIMIDIDRFKIVNDTYGHLVGDEVLRFLAEKLRETVDNIGYAFRYGGEEFAILIKDKTEQETYEIVEKFREKIAQTPSPSGKAIQVSLGISSSNLKDQEIESIIRRADTALYYSKETGRNKTTIYDERLSVFSRSFPKKIID